MTLLTSVFGADIPEDAYRATQAAIANVPASVDTLDAMRGRGLVLSHRDWIKADRVRSALAANWRELFRTVDVVLC
ncbi:amidase, partial [Klebsiella pneumoniae]